MILVSLIARIQSSLAKRREYLRLVSEINNLSSRDLSDLRADRAEMLFTARQQIYG